METNLRVLAVAHNETTLRLCLLGLGVEGMDVRHALDFENAVQSVALRRPDVIVLDTTIPGAGGVNTLRELKAHPATARIPVVTLTERAGTGEGVSHWIAGAAATIAKPFSLDELSQTVRRLGHMTPADLDAYRGDLLTRVRELA